MVKKGNGTPGAPVKYVQMKMIHIVFLILRMKQDSLNTVMNQIRKTVHCKLIISQQQLLKKV